MTKRPKAASRFAALSAAATPFAFAPIFAAAFIALLSAPNGASAQDRYEFLQMKKQVQQMSEEMERMRNALSGGDTTRRIGSLEDEISRLTGQIERLEFALKEHERAAKSKIEDLEYRIIELEGGDPSILFQDDGSDQGSLTPSIAPQPGGGQTLGVLTTTSEGVAAPADERAEFDAAVAAVQAGRDDGRSLMQRFVSTRPDSLLAGDGHYWLGESHFRAGDYRTAANRYLDGATLYPSSAKAPESLLKLGVTLNLLGQSQVACTTLREVGQRYPDARDAVARAEVEAARSGCS